ncbi:hypothetical protein ACFV1N_25335 [Streptosporangium canum]|uniref:hypothetical protein n=1 Tax=Streptosporangium canum TaxID=324952 RepID=UPI0036A620ED
MAKPPKVTGVHVGALLARGTSNSAHRAGRTVLMLRDGKLSLLSPDAFISGGTGHMLLTLTDLIEAGVRVAKDPGGRLAPDSGPLVDDIIAELNTRLAEAAR